MANILTLLPLIVLPSFPLFPNFLIIYLNCWSVFVSPAMSKCSVEMEQGINKVKAMQSELECSTSAQSAQAPKQWVLPPTTTPSQAPLSGSCEQGWWAKLVLRALEKTDKCPRFYVSQDSQALAKNISKNYSPPLYPPAIKINKNEKCGISEPQSPWICCVTGTGP